MPRKLKLTKHMDGNAKVLKEEPKVLEIVGWKIERYGTKTVIYGLGSDNKVYWWDKSLSEWVLYI